MSESHQAAACPGFRWGPFTLRIPLYHTRFEWPELLQGIFVAGATGLALVPVLTGEHYGFLLTFEEAVACVFLISFLIGIAPILFGEPYAPGWVTPALPLVLAFILQAPGGQPLFATPTAKFQMMAAMSIDFAVILLVLGVTGLGAKFVQWLPDALKAGIIMGAAIAALKRVFLDDAERFLLVQPVSTIVAVSVCLILTFSAPIQHFKLRYRWLAKLAGLGLLPGFLLAAIVGPLVGEFQYNMRPQILIPPFADTFSIPGFSEFILIPPFLDFFEKVSPLYVGWPSLAMLWQAFPLALMGYVILFGDLITGNEVLAAGMRARPDEKIDINNNRSHLSLAIRNAAMAVFAPFFPTQGCLWTGVQVIIVQRWTEGRKAMPSLYGGISSYYVFGVPIFYFCLPLLTGLQPLLGVALSLTLVLTGFACAYVAMGIPKTQIERGVVILIAVSLAVFPNPWIGMTVGILATLTLVGIKRHGDEEPILDHTVEEELAEDRA